MTNLEMRLELLKVRQGLTPEQAEAFKCEAIHHATSALNQAKILIEKKVDPEIMRQMMEGHGVGYDGKLKRFI